ncbi:MAG: C-GCAxxG-C-C family protein [Bacteroidetes bacterium]|nr:C-GCAxxG-C-C family protein [Bacteroidota bacterium]
MQDKKNKALSYFNNSFNCAQSVLTTFGPELGLGKDECLRIATAFGAGMGKQQHVCGAVSGALMVLGLKFGKALNDPESNKENTYDKAAEFLKRFESKNESIYCKQLLQELDMKKEKDLIKIHELGLFETDCINYIKQAVDITEQLINNE